MAKSDPLLEAYGSVDEANSAIGVVLALGAPDTRLAEVLAVIQNDLFDVGADLSTPGSATTALRVQSSWIERLEAWCDEFSAPLPALRSFLLPGGRPTSALLNSARTVVRRAERAAWRAAETEQLNTLAIRYLNRLSDLLFIMGRYANLGAGETLWVPAGSDQG